MTDTTSWKDTRDKQPPRAEAVQQHRRHFEVEERAPRVREFQEPRDE